MIMLIIYNDYELEKSMKCKICGQRIDSPDYLITKDYNYGGDEEFRYFECPYCNCLQLENIPEDLGKYYGARYYSFSMNAIEKKTNERMIQKLMKIRDKCEISNRETKGILGKMLITVLPRIAYRYIGIYCEKHSAILDVGCGDGYLLQLLKEMGYQNLTGLDKFLETTVEGEGLLIKKGEIQEITEKFDFIMCNHSFEHMDNPQEVIEQINNCLNIGGVCMICIPVSQSVALEQYGGYWVQLDAPRHLYLHSEASMSMLISNTKLKIKEIVYDSNAFQFIGSEQYRNGKNGADRRKFGELVRFTMLSLLKYGRLAKKVNEQRRGDQAIFILTKEG